MSTYFDTVEASLACNSSNVRIWRYPYLNHGHISSSGKEGQNKVLIIGAKQRPTNPLRYHIIS